ncbi:hypothetical protein BD324DRAFT_626130 [Kockovaella imperatae]|uniref:Fe2OG dioxygenase domain-containing protein n=1 Tax=Kockovaella imperatae TaxID=4999 RepID=A0A1Y1UHB7_9TREE|nr:hypothetical protein BD324DRAFT_626130 [Kockovaella imperatae]ORX37422.1 hypothetical protein BD324DRAFT_626130 [Kockovaella imperatae]
MSLVDLAGQLQRQDFKDIPIIDLSNARSNSVDARRKVAIEVRNACLNAGFFFVQNHGVPKHVVQGGFDAAKVFFEQDNQVKESVDISKSDNFRGYMKLLSGNANPESKGDLHEAFNLGLDPSLDAAPRGHKTSEGLSHSDNLWPTVEVWKGAASFRQAVLGYYSAVLTLGQSLFPLFALALDLPEDFFADKVQHPAAIMRLLHYPGTPKDRQKEENPGIGAHTDYECFTILAQGGVPGLQVMNRKGDWIDAPYIPDTFVINIGDQFARWTNDIFVSTPHRVLPPTQTRYSIPFFFGCDHDVPLIPPPTCITEDRPQKYPVVTAGAYVHSRLSETYTVQQEEKVA